MTKAMLRPVNDQGAKYDCLAFCCPGCAEMHDNDGLHMLPVNTTLARASWHFDGNFAAPTLSPSILTGKGDPRGRICHSFLRAGVFEFLTDSTHSLAGQSVPMPDLVRWAIDEANA